MTRSELIQSKEYIITGIQLDLMNLIEDYMHEKKINRVQLAQELSVDKSYVSQLLNSSFDHKLSKLVDLSLAVNKIPLVFFVDKNAFVKNDADDNVYSLYSHKRPRNVTFNPEANTTTQKPAGISVPFMVDNWA